MASIDETTGAGVGGGGAPAMSSSKVVPAYQGPLATPTPPSSVLVSSVAEKARANPGGGRAGGGDGVEGGDGA